MATTFSAHTRLKIQDPYTELFVCNKGYKLSLRENGGSAEEQLWELLPVGEDDYLIKNVHTGMVMVDDSPGDGQQLQAGASGAFNGLNEIDESQVWTISLSEFEVEGDKLYFIQNRGNGAYIFNRLRARGKKQLRTRLTNETSKYQAWRFILTSDDREELEISSDIINLTPAASRKKRSRSGHGHVDVVENYRQEGYERGEEGTTVDANLCDRDLYWNSSPPIFQEEEEEEEEDSVGACSKDSCFMEDNSQSWMSRPSWAKWISGVTSDFDGCWRSSSSNYDMGDFMKDTRYANDNDDEKDKIDGNDLIDGPWHFLPRLK